MFAGDCDDEAVKGPGGAIRRVTRRMAGDGDGSGWGCLHLDVVRVVQVGRRGRKRGIEVGVVHASRWRIIHLGVISVAPSTADHE